MVDLKLLEHLEGYLTEKRQQRFDEVLAQRTKHFTVCNYKTSIDGHQLAIDH